jgi:hypothetical protein
MPSRKRSEHEQIVRDAHWAENCGLMLVMLLILLSLILWRMC